MEAHPEKWRKADRLLAGCGWVVVGVVAVIVGGIWLLAEVVFVDRLTLHNTTGDPIVFAGARGGPGNVRESDIFVGPCETAEFEYEAIGWTTSDLESFEPIDNAVRVEVTVQPPFDGIAGARYVVVVTKEGAHEVDGDAQIPECASLTANAGGRTVCLRLSRTPLHRPTMTPTPTRCWSFMAIASVASSYSSRVGIHASGFTGDGQPSPVAIQRT